MHRFAVVSDPHIHALFPDYGVEGVRFQGRAGACVRSRRDSVESTRIFNESGLALTAALEACAAQGIRTVLIPGDLTDDGQAPSMEAALALLVDYGTRHDMRFFLCPGNHDAYGMSGRPHTKAFLTGSGGSVTVSSRPEDAGKPAGGETVHDPRMGCGSYVGLAEAWRAHGLMRDPRDLHWESPFGPDDSPASRMHDMTAADGRTTHRQIDLSYLVEPEPGLWLVSIDANVFEPRSGRPDNTQPDAFEDSTNAGWNALVRLKPFLLDWMADVARRAQDLGKTLICFSHYPVADVLRGTLEAERALFGQSTGVRRNPTPATTARVAATGIGRHFSGHLHYHATARAAEGGPALVNHAVPSPVAFPPAFLLASATPATLTTTPQVIDFAGFDAFFRFYGKGGEAPDWLEAATYPEFLYRHIGAQVRHRFLPNDWPQDLRACLEGRSTGDLVALARRDAPADAADPSLPKGGAGLPVTRLLTDWYALRSAGELARPFLTDDALRDYSALIAAYAGRHWADPTSVQARIQIFVHMLAQMLADAGIAPEDAA
ncbi:metallophosphoesterase family protein [Pseudotabrizicola algicola]|uniref:Metallophosphoesterase n=1 Tax=Pseudotabrizicola algicola TaxID=2709381 RepID=A0A6B3RVZ6_9RHOB|nr:metallophosphoesterase [Pseudotabrizicola algicola]NEX47292.1 metallophosphoesterase [Pseudotabrizicola algicola]